MRSKALRICITGGPCAGKTSALTWLNRRHISQFLTVPEVASFCVPIGLDRDVPVERLEFQRITLATQIALQERIWLSASDLGRHVLLDRGTIDGLAYVTDPLDLATQPDQEKMLNWYDVVIHLVSLSEGRPHLYSQNASNFRNESIGFARLIDNRLRDLWSRHSDYHSIKCEDTFEERMHVVAQILTKRGINLA